MGKACSRSKRKQIEFKVYNNVNWEVKNDEMKYWKNILREKRKCCSFVSSFLSFVKIKREESVKQMWKKNRHYDFERKMLFNH